MTNSRPASLLAKTLTRPVSTMYSESPTSPSLIKTVLRGKARVTPVAAIARNVSGCNGGVAGFASDIFSPIESGQRAHQCYHSPFTCHLEERSDEGPAFVSIRQVSRYARNDKCASAVLPLVLNDLAVVRKLAGQVKSDVAAQLGDIAHRRDDGVGVRRFMRTDFDVQRHPG